MDAVQFLMEEHQKVRQRFAEIERAAPQQRLELWRALEPELKIHEEIEDTYLYGPLSKDPAAQGTKLASFEDHQDQDVAALQVKIEQLHQTDLMDDKWVEHLRGIRDALMDHVKEEETEILPKVGDVWSREKVLMAGQQMATAKQEAMRNPTHYANVMGQMSTQETQGGMAGAIGRTMDKIKDTLGGS
jgi:hypothetical protein